MKTIKRIPLIWMNVTTSANWTRPPVGIVRVEQEICSELKKLLGDAHFKQCIWLDGEFIEWVPPSKLADKENEKILNSILPDSKSFDLSRSFISRAIKKFKNATLTKVALDEIGSQSAMGICTSGEDQFKPIYGDILISVGLDWDQPYTAEFYNLSRRKGIKIITCCYDLIPVIFPQYCVGDVARRFKEYFNMLTWGSTAVLCISEQTRKDYVNLCLETGAPERTTRILPLGDIVHSTKGKPSADVKSVLSEPFILFVSTIERRKNHEVLYRAYHLLCREGHREILPKLVFVGMAGWGIGDLLKDIELDPLTQGLIIQLNHVSDDDLSELYKHALFCAYPSLYEGWGLPVGEALALGKAVLASDQGSLPEVGGSLVKYLDPWNPRAWADSIYELATSPEAVKNMENNVTKNYTARAWREAALCVADLAKDIFSASGKVDLVLYPGYDFSTQVGVHVGPTIKSTGKGGYLIYGPHFSINRGSYRVTVFDIPLNRTPGNIAVDFVCDSGNDVLWQGVFYIQEANSEIEELLFSFDVTVNSLVHDYEIRCIVGDAHLSLSKVLIMEISID